MSSTKDNEKPILFLLRLGIGIILWWLISLIARPFLPFIMPQVLGFVIGALFFLCTDGFFRHLAESSKVASDALGTSVERVKEISRRGAKVIQKTFKSFWKGHIPFVPKTDSSQKEKPALAESLGTRFGIFNKKVTSKVTSSMEFEPLIIKPQKEELIVNNPTAEPYSWMESNSSNTQENFDVANFSEEEIYSKSIAKRLNEENLSETDRKILLEARIEIEHGESLVSEGNESGAKKVFEEAILKAEKILNLRSKNKGIFNLKWL